jgi:integrase
MAAKLEKTRTPGVYKRGSRYVFSYRVDGRQHWESCRTLDEARRAKSARTTDIGRGEFEQRSRVALHDFLRDWVKRYQGTGRRGYREETRVEDSRLLERFALRYFGPKVMLTDLTPAMVSQFVGWLCDGREQARNHHALQQHEYEQAIARAAGKPEPRRPRAPKPLAADTRRDLSDNTVRNAVRPLRAAMATARREGLIRHNPLTDAALPHRAKIEEDDDRPRPFPGQTMELVVALIHPKHRLMFDVLAATGVRRSELIGLEVRHLRLDGDAPFLSVRQRVRRLAGHGLVIGPLKSRYARRDIPIPVALADRLRVCVAARDDRKLVFQSTTGTILDPDNLAERVLAPACSEAGVEWAGFHTFRHTVASRLFAAGRNPVQVQRWLGHHSASFTLDTYVHLLDGDLGDPLERPSENNEGANKVQTDSTPLDTTREPVIIG